MIASTITTPESTCLFGKSGAAGFCAGGFTFTKASDTGTMSVWKGSFRNLPAILTVWQNPVKVSSEDYGRYTGHVKLVVQGNALLRTGTNNPKTMIGEQNTASQDVISDLKFSIPVNLANADMRTDSLQLLVRVLEQIGPDVAAGSI